VKILALNAGSHSFKAHVYALGDIIPEEPDHPLARWAIAFPSLPAMALLRSWNSDYHERSILVDSPHAVVEHLLDEVMPRETPDVIAHRVVAIGAAYQSDCLVDAGVRKAIETARELSPEHNTAVLASVDIIARRYPKIPQVAVLDSTFHRDLPEAASTYGVPIEWRDAYGIHRTGYHGLSHSYVTRRVARSIGGSGTRVVSCHLGGGASLAAVCDGRSVDTTMGFTPLEGLVMSTRSGSLDPGIVLYLLEHSSYTVTTLAHALRYDSGLRGLSGRSGDMREILANRVADPRSQLALDVYIHRLRGKIAAMAAALGGIDALVFTGGVGENAPEVRAAACNGMEFLGITCDVQANDALSDQDGEIGAAGAPVRTFVVRTREEWEVARAACLTLRAIAH